MKTFKQWLNGLSDVTQQYLSEKYTWIDLKSKDGYRHPKITQDIIVNNIDAAKETLTLERYYNSSEHVNKASMAFLVLNKESIPHDTYIYMLMEKSSDSDCKSMVDAEDLKEIRRIKYEARKVERENDKWSNGKEYKMSLNDFLLLSEDFSNLDWSKVDIESIPLNSATMEILGHDQMIKIAKEHPDRIDAIRYGRTEDNPIFDELFFCENGWTKEQKMRILDRYSLGVRDVEDFMRRIVAVDESYLRFVGTYFIEKLPALGMHLYKEKKDPEELNALPAGHKIEEEYRYPKEYRKLFQIAACCARGNVGKAMAGTIGDAACILKMYGYDFNKIFDCLYPQYAETNSEEQTEAVAI